MSRRLALTLLTCTACGDSSNHDTGSSTASSSTAAATTEPTTNGPTSPTVDPSTPTTPTTGATDPTADPTATTTATTTAVTTAVTTDPTGDPTGCVPITCAAVGAVCGALADNCGNNLDCGPCPGDQVCGNGVAPNQCGAPACKPAEQATTDGGGRCADLNQAWTARGINAGYYPYKAVAQVTQYSGDFGGDPASIFQAGGPTKGVILQQIPPGSYIGLSTTGPWYNPAGDCQQGDTCGNKDIDACTDNAAPLRPNVGGFYWGYAYQGASHMQGWIYYDPAALVFAGFDPAHPCALGPAGLDYEVASACGQATACADNKNRSCGDANPCSEGADDCGRVQCGAMSGGPLTPTAHRKIVSYPAGTHKCAKAVPNDSITCFANGNDADFFLVYPFGAYLYWGQNSTTKVWLHHGDRTQSYFHTRDAQGVMWDFVEVLSSGAGTLTPASDGAGAGGGCSADKPQLCTPCKNGGTCGWIQEVFLKPE
ncbi:MAG: hypothetical protein IPO88_11190 [Nannocystis sp.]|uniref:hypothetical protein n=1 Tax=Nannocystis sp. TaxID=1962667 RepID=UPI0024299F25|nr:hypothetical protein [Nannocystis sp.]MBK9754052.1 hypothetical protein [Nannocystis sp.]